jgi:outer membrane protein with beta-barrel domain
MNNMRYAYLFIAVIVSHMAVAQERQANACVQNIETAQQRYDEGRIQDIQALLTGCLEAGNYTKAEESQALRLLTLSYIFLDDEDKSEATILRLLMANHEFEVNPAIDPTEFINLYDRYRTKPLFNLGVRYIVNFAQPVVTGLNSTLNLRNNRPTYSTVFGNFGLGLNFEYEFAHNLVIYPEIQYKSMTVASTFSQTGTLGTPDYITIDLFENQSWLSLPVSVKYLFNFKSLPFIKAYVNLGGSVDFLLNTNIPSDKGKLQTLNDPVVGFTIKDSNDHNRLNFGILAGAGITYKMGEGFIAIEGRYLYSFTKLVKPEAVLNPGSPEKFNTGSQEDIYSLNHIAISLGYTWHIYFPKKRK